jgi:hypothetical protein
MTPVISNAMRVQIEAAAVTLHPSIRQGFINGIVAALSHSTNPTLNDTLRAHPTRISYGTGERGDYFKISRSFDGRRR